MATRSHDLGSNKGEASTSGGVYVTIVILVKVMIMMITAMTNLWLLKVQWLVVTENGSIPLEEIPVHRAEFKSVSLKYNTPPSSSFSS